MSIVLFRDPNLKVLPNAENDQIPEDFEHWRSALNKLQGEELLNALITPEDPSQYLQLLPTEDVHYFIHQIGLGDSELILSQLSDQQVQELLDMEIWEGDEIDVKQLDQWLYALLRSNPEKIVSRLLALDDATLSWIVKLNAYAYAVDDPDSFEAPDFEHIVTPDHTLCIVFPRSENKDLPVKVFLDQLFREDSGFCINLMMSSSIALNVNLIEEAYEERMRRMNLRGYVDYFEAKSIFNAVDVDDLKEFLPPVRIASEVPPSHRWLNAVINTDQRLDLAFSQLEGEDLLIVAESLGYLCNMVLSADRIPFWDLKAQEKALHFIRAMLTLALEILNGHENDPKKDSILFQKIHINLLFKLGYGKIKASVSALESVAALLKVGSDATGALLELPTLKEWAVALLQKHPTFTDKRLIQTLTECELIKSTAQSIAELAILAKDRPAEVGIAPFLFTQLFRNLLELKDEKQPIDPTPKKLNKIYQCSIHKGTLRDEFREKTANFFKKQGKISDLTLLLLLKAWEDQWAKLNEESLDPKYLTLLWLDGVDHIPMAVQSNTEEQELKSPWLSDIEENEDDGDEISVEQEVALFRSEQLKYEDLSDEARFKIWLNEEEVSLWDEEEALINQIPLFQNQSISVEPEKKKKKDKKKKKKK